MPKPGEQSSNMPILSFQHLTMIDICTPSPETINDPSQMFMSSSLSELELLHLEIIPRRPETRPDNNTVPVIVAVFSYLSHAYSGNEIREMPYSILSRWDLHEEKPVLNSAFTQLGLKKSISHDLKVCTAGRLAVYSYVLKLLTGRICSQEA